MKFGRTCRTAAVSAVIFCAAAAHPAENTGLHAAPQTIFSLETGYLFTGMQNNGWGLGFSIEQEVFDYLSVKGTFSHMTFTTAVDDVYCTSVGLSLYANYYPFGRGLNLLYVGAGSGIDFLNYFGSGTVPAVPRDTVISAIPVIGWKQNFPALTFSGLTVGSMIDVYSGWQFVVSNTGNLPDDTDYTSRGWLFGIKIRVFIEKHSGP
jgi:hypothetical protein